MRCASCRRQSELSGSSTAGWLDRGSATLKWAPERPPRAADSCKVASDHAALLAATARDVPALCVRTWPTSTRPQPLRPTPPHPRPCAGSSWPPPEVLSEHEDAKRGPDWTLHQVRCRSGSPALCHLAIPSGWPSTPPSHCPERLPRPPFAPSPSFRSRSGREAARARGGWPSRPRGRPRPPAAAAARSHRAEEDARRDAPR